MKHMYTKTLITCNFIFNLLTINPLIAGCENCPDTRVSALQNLHKRIDLDIKNRVLLTHSLLAKLDGIFIGATQVKRMLNLIALIRTLQVGVYHKETKTHEGLFIWKNQKVGIHDLAKIEQDPNLTPEDQKLLKKMLHKAREQFLLKTDENSKNTEPIKPYILSLITECCKKREIENSFLLSWGKTSRENEAANFHHGILSFHDFDLFLSHLTIFMKDLIYSCPKAFEQFNEVYGANHNRQLNYEETH